MPSKLTGERVKQKNRIILVDDHAVFRQGLAMLLEQESELLVTGQFHDGASALKAAPALKPDLAIIDITLEGMNGIDLTKNLRARLPEIRILVLSMHKEFLYAERALRAGADGYIMKQETGEKLIEAIRRVLKGDAYVSEAVNELLLDNLRSPQGKRTFSPVERLSNRELEIFQLIAKGHGTRQIADALSLSMRTVETHREHIRDKLNLGSSFELVQYAVEWSIGRRP